MKILVLADDENKAFWDYYKPGVFQGTDLVISCGDLSPRYLEFIETMTNVPLLYVRGNHDRRYGDDPPQGCICIEEKVYDFHGLRILGLGGSMRYQDDVPNQFTENEMRARLRRVRRDVLLKNGFDVLVTHAPAKGYGDMSDLPHRGFACFNELMGKYHPKYMLHGHVHATYTNRSFVRENTHACGTRIINAYDHYWLEVGEDEHPPVGQTGSFIYDLIMSMRQKNNKYQ